MRTMSCAIALLAIAAPGYGQDLPTTQVEDHGRVVLQDSTTRALLRNSRARQAQRRPTPAQISACASKAQFRAKFGANHPKVQRLYELCRGVGL
ncbi:hypothetical protein FHS95_000633 [Sphingomonas naasensis]|uniref:UrcA family protein n=1 Tax=Sphingomonas naasensis TaxID=1344951 RepID=A0A4S1WX44_9SPHN|nr:hypothetical protein [Sphingomonas naasensis]NIJ18964.1 hypothetical protein [Sphingomonas naasensis]TGX46176.1 hypothetical protein E5A74_03165 [Sphingomonas naasensis]